MIETIYTIIWGAIGGAVVVIAKHFIKKK